MHGKSPQGPTLTFEVGIHQWREPLEKSGQLWQTKRRKAASQKGEIGALGQVISTGNQAMKTKKRASEENNTHRLGRASGLIRWYRLPVHKIVIESHTAEIPNPTSKPRMMNVPLGESIAAFGLGFSVSMMG
jgi:hypothetical protein